MCTNTQDNPFSVNNGNINTGNYQFKVQTLNKASRALYCIPNDLPRSDWIKIATALKTEFGSDALGLFLEWSETGKKADRINARATFKSLVSGRVGIGTLYYYARQYGYTEEKQQVSSEDIKKQKKELAQRKAQQARREAEEQANLIASQKRAQTAINEVLPFLIPATTQSTLYLKNKQSDGQGAYLIYSEDINKTTIARHTYPFNVIKKGALFIPFQNFDGKYVGAQLIANGVGKLNVKGSIKKGAFAHIGAAPLPYSQAIIYIGEGYATVNSALQANPEAFGVMAVDAGNLPLVADLMRQRYQNAHIVILADNDKSGVGQEKAKEASKLCGGAFIIPEWIEGQIKSTDVNDLHVIHGLNAIRDLLESIKLPYQSPANNEDSNTISNLSDIPQHPDNIEAWLDARHTPELPQTLVPPSYYEDSLLPSFVDKNENQASEDLLFLRDTIYYKRALQSAQHYQKRKEQGKKAYYTIDQEWVLEGLCVAIDLGITSIKIKSEMGTGKSFAVRWLLKNHYAVKTVLLITALASLNRSAISSATTHGLNGVVYNDMQEGDNHEIISTTFNSADKVIQKRSSYKFDLVLIDESEQCSGFMTSQNKSIKNLATASKTIKQICRESGVVILADAHLGANTHTFAEHFCSDRDFCPMFNNFKKYADITYSVLEDYDQGIARLELLLDQGKNVFCVFTSGELAHNTMKMLKDQGITTGIKTIEVTKETKLDTDAQDALATPEKFKQYQMSVISPIAGTGISIEGAHYHETVAFITRDFGRTPNSKTALQMPFRNRELIDKHITIIKIDSPDFKNIDDFEAIDERTNLQLDFHSLVRKRVANNTATKEEIDLYYRSLKSQMLYDAQIQKNQIADYWKFWDNFFWELKNKGMKQVTVDTSNASFNTKEAKRDAKASIALAKMKDFIEADYVDDKEYKKLIITDKHQPEMLSIEQSLQLKKRIIIDKFLPLEEGETPQPEDASMAYGLYIGGYSGALNNVHLSQLTKREAKKILNSDINGIGDYLDGKLDDFNMSPARRESELAIFKPVATIIGLRKNDDGEYSIKHKVLDDKLCRSKEGHRNQTLLLKKAIKVYNAFHPDESNLSITKLKNRPAEFVRDILSKKFKIFYKKTRGKEIYTLDSSRGGCMNMLDLLNTTNSNIYAKKLQKIAAAVQRDKDRTLQADIESLIANTVEPVKLQLPLDNKLHLIDNLMRIPSNMRVEILNKYLSTAQKTERQNPRFTPLAWAHKELKIDADFYDK